MKVSEIADAWIEYHLTGDELMSSAAEKMQRLVLRDPERAWQIILNILKKDNSEAIISNLAAGPLEDLLVEHGDVIIERVEIKTARDPHFKKLIMGVWQNSMDQDIWSRVESLQRSDANSAAEV